MAKKVNKKCMGASCHWVSVLRFVMGWFFFYAGFSKLFDPGWTSAGYLKSALTFSEFYAWLASPGIIVWVDLLNQWGLTLIGLGLILGAFTRLASYSGVLLMALYFFPRLLFPFVENGLIVDKHIIYIFVFIVLAMMKAGDHYGLDSLLKKKLGGEHWWL